MNNTENIDFVARDFLVISYERYYKVLTLKTTIDSSSCNKSLFLKLTRLHHILKHMYIQNELIWLNKTLKNSN